MNRPDFDEFAALWQDEPDPREQAQMEADARAARRRGRLFDYIEYFIAFLLLAIPVAGLFLAASPLTLVLAVPLMIMTTWLTWRRRTLRQMARTLNTADRASFIESSLRNARVNLRRNTIGLAFLPFVVPIALTFKVSLRTGGGPYEVWEALVLWSQTPRAAITIVLLTVLAGFTVRNRRKLWREIERLENLRDGYALEAEQEGEE
jgi:heme exporter protein D